MLFQAPAKNKDLTKKTILFIRIFQRDIGDQGVNRQFPVPDFPLEPFWWRNRRYNDFFVVDHHCCIGDDRFRSLAECQEIKSGAPLFTT